MEIFPSGYKRFGKSIEIFDESLLSTDIDLSLEFGKEQIPEEDVDESRPPIEYYSDFMQAYNERRHSWLNECLFSLIGFTQKVEILDTQELVTQGVLCALIDLAKNGDIDFSFKSFCVLINISARANPSNDPLNTDDFFNFLCEMMNEAELDMKIFSCVLRCFSNYAENSEINRNKVLGVFPINRLEVIFLQSKDVSVQREIIHLVYIYTKHPIDPQNGSQIITLCQNVLIHEYSSYFDYALWALLCILRQHDAALAMIFTDEIADQVCKLVGSSTNKIRCPALLLLGFFLEAGNAVNNLRYKDVTECYTSEDVNIQLNSFYVTKYLAKVMPEKIEKLINADFFNQIYYVLHDDFKFTTKIEAAKLFNFIISSGGKSILERLCVNGAVTQFIYFFEFEDNELILDTLNAMYKLFENENIIEPNLFKMMLSRFKTIGGFEAVLALHDLGNDDISAEVDLLQENIFDNLDIEEIPLEVDSDDNDDEED